MSAFILDRKISAAASWTACAIWLLCACTHNPLSKDETIFSHSIRGQIALSDGAVPDHALVWLRDTQISTRTLQDGSFELNIPSAAMQSGSSLNGEFALYFYVANYRMDSLQVVFQNGNLLFGQKGLDENGFLTRVILLYKFLDISVGLDPAIVYEGQAATVYAYVSVKALDVWTMARGYFSKAAFKGDPTFMAGFLSSGDAFTPILQPNKIYSYGEFPIDVQTMALLPVVLTINPGEVTAGEYEIIPFLFIPQTNLPAGLLAQLGSHCRDFDPDYANMPIKIANNRLYVFK